MRYSTTLLATAIAAAAPSLQAAQTFKGNAVIVNQCDYPLHMWSVDEYNKPAESDYITIAPRSTYTEPLRIPNKGCNCGVSLKLSKTTSLASPITQFEYTVNPAWKTDLLATSYDISFVNCATAKSGLAAIAGYDVFSGHECPAWAEGISIKGTGSSCPIMDCKAGEFCYLDAYFEPEPARLLKEQPVRQCANGDQASDIVFTACTNNGSGESSDPVSVSSSQAAPSSSSSTPSPSPSSSSSSSSIPSVYSAPKSTPSYTPSVVAAEFAPIASSANYPTATPEITAAPVITAAAYVATVYTTVETTMYVDTAGVRVNQDGSKYYGRRFAA